MKKRLSSVDSKEVIGGLETNFTLPQSGSAVTKQNSYENNETETNSLRSSTDQDTNLPKIEKPEVLNNKMLRSKNSEIQNESSTPKFGLSSDDFEVKTSKMKFAKSVSFRTDDQEVSSLSNPSYISSTNLSNVTQINSSISTTNSLKTGIITSGRNMQVLEDIPELDETFSDVDKDPGYYGWDGYEARFEESIADHESWSSIPGCIPPWAKSVRNKYGLLPIKPLDEDQVAESNRTMQEKLENLMKKHKELMLLKRVESKKQLIVEPNKDPTEMDTVQMRAKSTRYYMAPLVFNREKQPTDDYIDDEKVSLPSLSDNNSLSITKKTSRPQAKKEISQVLKSMQKNLTQKKDETKDYKPSVKKENEKCPKITLNDIRDFVNMTPDERKLHEIIKIEKVPSIQDLKEKGKPSSKYIINVPKNTITDKPTVNVIKIKEKRKLRVDSIENIEEKVTELHYNSGGTRRLAKRESDFINRDSCDIEPKRHIKTKKKSPTETKSFEVKTRQTPLLSPLINEDDKETEKVLLLQYDKKSKKDKYTTQLVGVKKPYTSDPGEMYLYGSETEGKKVKEHVTTGQEIPITLKDKVHSIFEELRGLKLMQSVPADQRSVEVQARPSVYSKITQRPSDFSATTEVLTVEKKPEVRSASIQVRQSQILERSSDSFKLETPHSTPLSGFQEGSEDIQPSLDKTTLHERLDSLVQDKDSSEKPKLSDKVIIDDEQKKYEGAIEQEIIKDASTDEVESKSETIELEELLGKDETMKKDILDDKVTTYQSDEAEITEVSDKENEIISKDDTKEKTEKEQEDTRSELSKVMSKTLSKEESKDPDEQLKEEDQILAPKGEMRKLSKTSPEVSVEKLSFKSPQDEYFETFPTTDSDERKISLKQSDGADDKKSDRFFKTSFSNEYEDIRSYEFGSQQGTELVIKSSSKFLHQKDGMRKKMNWTDDTIFLENNTCPQLIRGLAQTAMRQPADPLAYLAHWIYKDCENRERTEEEEVRQEHLQLARAMAEVAGGDAKTRKRFNVKKYPINIVDEEKRSTILVEGEFPEDNLENNLQSKEIIQEA